MVLYSYGLYTGSTEYWNDDYSAPIAGTVVCQCHGETPMYCVGHNYIGHSHTDHSHVGHTYIGCDCVDNALIVTCDPLASG